MSKPNETGHAINVANFEDLITFNNGLENKYQPVKEMITLPALNTKHTAAKQVMNVLNGFLPTFTLAVNNRALVFAPLHDLAGRIPYAAASTGASEKDVADVQTLVHKLRGTRAAPAPKDNPETPENESDKSHSASQLSFDSRVANLDKLVKLLTAIPGYKPNETELTVGELANLLAAMRAANTAVIEAYRPVSNARINRNEELYHPVTGLVQTAKEVKNYIKGVFKVNSPQYKQVSKIKFTNYKP